MPTSSGQKREDLIQLTKVTKGDTTFSAAVNLGYKILYLQPVGESVKQSKSTDFGFTIEIDSNSNSYRTPKISRTPKAFRTSKTCTIIHSRLEL